MIITTEKAIELMADGKAIVRRFDAAEGVELEPATEWTPDENWATTRDDNGQCWAIITVFENPMPHHVML